MGWFDDDDDDDEEEEKAKKPSLAMAFDKSNDNNDDDDEEEDPLDAYMSNIQKTITKEKKEPNSKNSIPKAGRLDVENAEEATSHWETAAAASSSKNNDNNDDDGDDDDDDDYFQHDSTKKGKTALDTMFHKATTTKDPNRQINIQLDQVNHQKSNYAPFIKQLWVPSNSSSTSTNDNNDSAHEWRRKHSISCYPPMEPIYEFAELQSILPQQLLEWNRQSNILQPTLVQSQTLGVALAGKDAIITASTGSGKTLAYLWPLVTHLMENNHATTSSSSSSSSSQQRQHPPCRALVLVPTRELALQVETVAKRLVQNLPIIALAITGGNLGRYQLSQTLIKTKPHLVVATPGRLLDVLSAQQKSKQDWLLPNITFLVLDEADKMLQLGFAPQVTQVLENLRPDRQSLLTSATLSNKLEQYCTTWMNRPIRISIGRTGQSSSHVQQHVLCLPTIEAKRVFLQESLPTFCQVGRTIVFCATRQGCEELASHIASSSQILLQTLHGDKHPSDRNAALKAFAKGQVSLLIATDVAGRGLDIPQVATVINFDPAKNWDTHVHRIGRAGRLSTTNQRQEEGSAYTLLLPSNREFAQTMVSAYEREGRQIPEELYKLARSTKRGNTNNNDKASGSKHYHHHTKHDKTGLGFSSSMSSTNHDLQQQQQQPDQHYRPPHHQRQQQQQLQHGQQRDQSSSSYYGPAKKKSRWS